MDGKLIFAIITITLALVFYTIGVFSERRSKTLKKWHVITFWLGLVFDTTGTLTMERIASLNEVSNAASGISLHGITGMIAIILMLFHAIWATWVLFKGNDKKKLAFHKFSLLVWIVWLIPYIIGMVIGMS